MNKISASIQRSEESLRKLCKVQQLLFYRKQQLMSLFAGCLTVLFSLVFKNGILSLIILFLGCWFIVGSETPPVVKAKAMFKELNPAASLVCYRFELDGFMVKTAIGEKAQDYGQIKYLVEDARYLYLFRGDESGYMIDKTTVAGLTENGVSAFLAKKCHTEIVQIRELKSLKNGFSFFRINNDCSGKRFR